MDVRAGGPDLPLPRNGVLAHSWSFQVVREDKQAIMVSFVSVTRHRHSEVAFDPGLVASTGLGPTWARNAGRVTMTHQGGCSATTNGLSQGRFEQALQWLPPPPPTLRRPGVGKG
ncbi:unnamed protein product [Soboliphyme baturini]|uniref:Secreted protein n=1 Tax=Soboliphyme baturini TaxID=241478 RepID=A0A183IGX6_9BILA|nr:unnamed protein product [Soboliphyme baturini]